MGQLLRQMGVDDVQGNGLPADEPRQIELRVPAIELAGCSITVGPYARDPKLKAIIVGPIMLAIPLDTDAAREVVKGLTGVYVAEFGEAPGT